MPADTPDDDPLRTGYDEAFASDGTPREHYAAVIQVILESGPGALASAMTASARTAGLSLGTGSAARLLPVDPVPRAFAPGEWSNLEAGLIQRARMLEAVVGGIYGGPSLPDGVLPEGVVSTSVYLERDLLTTALAGPALGIVGFDVVRRPDGTLAVLEDNLLTPGHVALPALRDLSPLRAATGVADVAAVTAELLGAMLGGGDEAAAILSDEPGKRASWELQTLGSMLRIPVLGYEDLQVRDSWLCTRSGRRIEVLWQRTSEDRLRDDAGDRRRTSGRSSFGFAPPLRTRGVGTVPPGRRGEPRRCRSGAAALLAGARARPGAPGDGPRFGDGEGDHHDGEP